jgi:hypothetical protein
MSQKILQATESQCPPTWVTFVVICPLPLTLTFREIKESEEKRREEKLLTIPALQRAALP